MGRRRCRDAAHRLDRRERRLCTSFYATTPVCSPSRASFVSGRYPQNTPVVTNNIPLDDEIVTFAEILAPRGIRTGYAGKWHLDGSGKPQWAPERQFGFDDNRYMFNRGHWKQMEDTPDGPRVKARNGTASRPTAWPARTKNRSHGFPGRQDGRVHPAHTRRTVLLHGQPARSARSGHRASALRHDVRRIRRTSQPRSARKPAEGLPSWGQMQERRIRPWPSTTAWSSASTTTWARSSTHCERRTAGQHDRGLHRRPRRSARRTPSAEQGRALRRARPRSPL